MVKIKALVVFGSASDNKIYEKIIKVLKNKNIDYELRICSAHRTPDEVTNVLSTPHDVVIAGAGLAAALPGIVASKTIKPVIGVPVKSNYFGLDALLSIAQMPPGIPVLAVGVDKAEVAAEEAIKMQKHYEKVTIIADKETKAVKKAKDTLDKFGIKYETALKTDPESINIEFVYFDEPMEQKDELCIYCPMLIEDDDKAEAALNLLDHTNHGLWVGLNRGENAALAAVQIINKEDKFSTKLHDFREEGAKKVKQQDKEERKK